MVAAIEASILYPEGGLSKASWGGGGHWGGGGGLPLILASFLPTR